MNSNSRKNKRRKNLRFETGDNDQTKVDESRNAGLNNTMSKFLPGSDSKRNDLEEGPHENGE